MKRRLFLFRSAGMALCGAVPLGVAAAVRGSLFEDPQAWVGDTFRLPDGSRVQLARVDQQARDRHSTQFRLQFRTLAGTPTEGTQALAGAWSEDLLFLQHGMEGPVAWVNRLHVS